MLKCPICGTGGAYVGLREVKCLNSSCRHFNDDYALERHREEIKDMHFTRDEIDSIEVGLHFLPLDVRLHM